MAKTTGPRPHRSDPAVPFGTPRRRILQSLRRVLQLVRETLLIKRSGESHIALHPEDGELGVTFLGHSSFLLEAGGGRVLVDPVFSNWLILVRRLRHPGVLPGNMPDVDWVLITHAHMDHLDRRSLRLVISRTRELTGRAPGVILPRNTADIVRDLGFSQIVELERWQTFHAGAFRVTHTPARHWGARLLHDNHRGFGGYMLQGAGHSVYHSGDTAYFEGFREIGRRLHPRLALLPIGAYSPDSFRGVHTSPEDALQGFLDLGADTMVPMHYGTFKLSEEPMTEPLQRLRAAAEQAGVAERVQVLTEGKTVFFAPRAESGEWRDEERIGA